MSLTMDVGKDPLTGKQKQITKGGFKTKKVTQKGDPNSLYCKCSSCKSLQPYN